MARRAEATPGHPNKSVTRKQTPDDTNNAAREEENSGEKQKRRRNNGRARGSNSSQDDRKTGRESGKQIGQSRSSRGIRRKKLQRNHSKHLTLKVDRDGKQELKPLMKRLKTEEK